MSKSKFNEVFQVMKRSRPNLLLGDGFNIGSLNEKDEKVPFGRKVANDLYSNLLIEKVLSGSPDVRLLKCAEKLRNYCQSNDMPSLAGQLDKDISLTKDHVFFDGEQDV